jgi:4-hydroxymandelate oxidase
VTDPLADAVSVPDLERLAAQVIGDGADWDYLTRGAGDGWTLRANPARWASLRLAPHCLVDVSVTDTSIRLLDRELPHPVLLAPVAGHRRWHPEGEVAAARGAAEAQALFVLSTLATATVEEVGAATDAPWWFQVYVHRDRSFTRDLVQRAAAAGASALVLTADTPVLGARDRERGADLSRPGGHEVPHLQGLLPDVPDLPPHRRVYNPWMDPGLTWDTVGWLSEAAALPVLVKGVLRPDDAAAAVDVGAAGVIVSNHGGRNLDTVPATVDALGYVVDRVAGRVPVLVDGGIRRGTDVAKALCLGAAAVMVGRPYVWGLAVAGASGVRHAVEILSAELTMAMALLGAPRTTDLTRDLLWPGD